MSIGEQLKMQILLGDFDRDGKGGRRFPRRRRPARGGLVVAGSVAIVAILAIIAAL